MKTKLHLKKDAYLIIIIFVIVLLSMAGFIYAFLKYEPKKECLKIDYNEDILINEMKQNEEYNYQVKVKNICEKTNLNISIETLNESVVKENNVLINDKLLSSYPAKVKELNESDSSHLIFNEEIGNNEEKIYDFKIMMSNDLIDESVINNLYHGKIVVN